MGRVNPASTPASVSASATRNKYAGPLPMSPVTASSSVLGDAHDRPDGGEDALGPLEIVVGDRLSAAQRRGTLAEQRRRVGDRTHDGHAVTACSLQGVDRHAGSNRQHPPGTGRSRSGGRGLGVVRLDRDHRCLARRNGCGNGDLGKHLGQRVSSCRSNFDDDDVACGPAVGDEATDKGGAHVAATHHGQPIVRHGGRITTCTSADGAATFPEEHHPHRHLQRCTASSVNRKSGSEAAGETESDHRRERLLAVCVHRSDDAIHLVGGYGAERKFAAQEQRVFDSDREVRADELLVAP